MANSSTSSSSNAAQVGQAIRSTGDLSGKTRWKAIETSTARTSR